MEKTAQNTASETEKAADDGLQTEDPSDQDGLGLLGQRLRSTRQHMAQALDSLRQMVHLGEDAEWKTQLERLRGIAAFVEDRCAMFEVSRRAFLLPDQFQHFSTVLRERRETAHLSREDLSKRAGLSECTIKHIELGKHSPTKDTVLRLLEVQELGLSWNDVLGDANTSTDASADKYNCFIPPGYEPVRMVQQLVRLLNGPGGHIEQTYSYLEHRSAIAYMALGQDPRYVAYRASYPIAELAQKICAECGPAPLKVIALGPGDGTLEVRLVQQLLDDKRQRDIEFILFDISQPLLNTAYQHALDTFGERSPVHTLMVQGNFHDMAGYKLVTHAPVRTRRRRLFTMMGNTIANLDNEPRFFQHCMSHCRLGDLLVLDIQCSAAPADASEEQIRTLDPGLNGSFPEQNAKWLKTPIHMQCPDLESCDLKYELDVRCPIPGSYALDAIATVKARGKPERRFSLFRFKKYNEVLVKKTLAGFGWECLLSMSFGVQDRPSISMLLVRRDTQTPPLPGSDHGVG